MWSLETNSETLYWPFVISEVGEVAHLSEPYWSTMSLRTGADIQRLAVHLKNGDGACSLTWKVLASGAERPSPLRKAGILAASLTGSRLAEVGAPAVVPSKKGS